mmetsp:Transcript_27938/g.80126  ORF Transcript_27938/g.80126 Transcript_27938/m.80126 type:complete len:218 (+) Transcript_27938:734-1387(+)
MDACCTLAPADPTVCRMTAGAGGIRPPMSSKRPDNTDAGVCGAVDDNGMAEASGKGPCMVSKRSLTWGFLAMPVTSLCISATRKFVLPKELVSGVVGCCCRPSSAGESPACIKSLAWFAWPMALPMCPFIVSMLAAKALLCSATSQRVPTMSAISAFKLAIWLSRLAAATRCRKRFAPSASSSSLGSKCLVRNSCTSSVIVWSCLPKALHKSASPTS